MHHIAIDPAMRARGVAARGLNPPRRPVDPIRMAHLIIDLQNGFMEPGAPFELPVARAIVPTVNRISRALRDGGGLNVFLRWTTDMPGVPYWGSAWDGISPETRARIIDAFSVGSHYHALWEGLDRATDEPIVDKGRSSAFIPGTCSLDAMLKERGIDTVIITGCLTNGCCESTARTAMEGGYRVFFIEDGTATVTDAEHNATLSTLFGSLVAEVLSAEDMVECLADASAARTAAPLSGS